MAINTFTTGFFTSGALIVAIGAQNAFVLRKGLQNDHIFLTCLICFLCDFILMSLGVFGLGEIVSKNETTQIILAVLGSAFLLFYGISSLKRAWEDNAMSVNTKVEDSSAKKTILSTLAITLLNPHVYIDTVVVVGGIAGTLNFTQKLYFITGALFASFIWFFGLGYGATKLTPLFKKPYTWKILDFIIAIVMFIISYHLISFAYNLMFN